MKSARRRIDIAHTYSSRVPWKFATWCVLGWLIKASVGARLIPIKENETWPLCSVEYRRLYVIAQVLLRIYDSVCMMNDGGDAVDALFDLGFY